ncbi:MAG: serine/threonine-protein kinase [Myxococcota bacterium]
MLRAAIAGMRLLPRAVRKPRILLRWLAGARGAQLATVVFLAFLSFGLPIVLEELERLYPPVLSKNVWGRLFRVERVDPLLEERRRQLTALTWIGGVGGVTFLLLGTLPRTVARASQEARDLEASAGSLPAARSSESLVLLREAESLTLALGAEAAPDVAEKSPESGAAEEAPATTTPDTELRALRAAETVIDPVAPPAGTPLSMGGEQRYRIVKELGRGGMGVVYEAFDVVLEREVALKELPLHLTSQREFVRRFKQEARLLARLSHPNIVQVHDLVEHDERIWIAMELVKGGTLADAIERSGGALPWSRALQLAEQICRGLDYAHSQGVIHRDIKPINVLLTQDENGAAKITDFGLAKHVGASAHTQEGTLLGSVPYMSPEQAAGRKADTRSDVYSVGITLYEMFTGHVPFEGEVAAVLAQHVSQPPARLRRLRPDVPEGVEGVVHRMLAKRPEQRPASLARVAETLTGVASGVRPATI